MRLINTKQANRSTHINFLKLRPAFFILSTFLILASTYGLLTWKLKISIEFTGGVNIRYSIKDDFSTEDLLNSLKEKGLDVESIQSLEDDNYLFKLGEITQEQKLLLLESFKDKNIANFQEVTFEKVGPSLGEELIKKTLTAIVIATLVILLWVAYQFKSISFGAAAILAMLHDTFILIGAFAFLGHFMGIQVDFLVVTAILTTLSFSVHDTIVVYDRIRELRRKEMRPLIEIANHALNQTMRRSINNSLTIIFMLASLAILGGSTIRPFAVALAIGTVLGTYSSPFVAVPLLLFFENLKQKIKR